MTKNKKSFKQVSLGALEAISREQYGIKEEENNS